MAFHQDVVSGDKTTIRKTDDVISARVSVEQARLLLKRLYDVNVLKIKRLNGYDDINYHVLLAPENSNPYIGEICEIGYVFKIINSEDSKWPLSVDMQCRAMFCLNSSGITAPLPVKNLQGQYFSLEYLHEIDDNDDKADGNRNSSTPACNIVRLCTYIPGMILYDHPNPSLEIFENVGRLVADIGNALKSLDGHLIFDDATHGTMWHMKNHHWLKDYIYATRDAQRRKLLMEVVTAFQEKVLSKTDALTQCIIHNDINEQNILVRPRQTAQHGNGGEEQYEICGILDFSDINKSCQVFDVAITIMYMMTLEKEASFLDIGAAVLRGYREKTDLTATDLEVLPYAVAMRYAISLGMGEHGITQHPENAYMLTTAKQGWRQLEEFWQIPSDQLKIYWQI